jgi:Tfp pilus assembly protein PilF
MARCSFYERRKEYEKAKSDINMALELESENPECYLTRASLYIAMKKKRLAQQDCRTAIKLGATPEQVAPLLGALQ